MSAVLAGRSGAEAERPGRAIGICTSTGGPGVLAEILRELPADFMLPILIVQHIAAGFIDGLRQMLDDELALPVAMARDGAPLRPGVWLAPEDAHLTLTPSRRLALDHRTVAGPHRPSADLLLASLAAVLGAGAVAVVLTGMGRDGARGAAEIKAAGGLLLAQDEATSRIYGMPRAAVEAGARPLSPAQIAAALHELRPARR
ncbi:MAG TPA: CheB methylesterase domain-containing protein [Conexibacter sp.]|jgi:two-component system chemotaxis response regulator CheB|nr:CheB methylesterase domain-containing protein [Conexibacter sp.]